MQTLENVVESDRPSIVELIGPAPKRKPRKFPINILTWPLFQIKKASYNFTKFGLNTYYNNRDNKFKRKLGLVIFSLYEGSLFKKPQTRCADLMNLPHPTFTQNNSTYGFVITTTGEHAWIAYEAYKSNTNLDNIVILTNISLGILINGTRAYLAYKEKIEKRFPFARKLREKIREEYLKPRYKVFSNPEICPVYPNIRDMLNSNKLTRKTLLPLADALTQEKAIPTPAFSWFSLGINCFYYAKRNAGKFLNKVA
jgi:hypothetical protein